MEGRLKRSIQHIYRLRLEVSDTHESHEVVSEDCVKAGSVIGIIVSELISMAMALAAGIYTRYSPPNHPAATIHKTKAEADKAEAEEHH